MDGTYFETAQPSLIPGYAGYLPQYIFRVGDTYGKTSHKILLDPNINFAERLILSNRNIDDSTVLRPNVNDIELVEDRSKYRESIFRHPVIPGYDGTIPGITGKYGQRFSAEATVALSDFEKLQQSQGKYRKQLETYKTVQCDEGEPGDLLHKLVSKTKTKLPLKVVRPEAAGILRIISLPESVEDADGSPYFLDPGHKDKHFKSGFAGHIPYGWAHFGASHNSVSTAALVDFTNNYRRRLSTEWAPSTVSHPDPPDALMPPEIYHRHVGMLPNYMGHLPGAQFRFGKTFGNDTRDAKRWLRGDFS